MDTGIHTRAFSIRTAVRSKEAELPSIKKQRESTKIIKNTYSFAIC